MQQRFVRERTSPRVVHHRKNGVEDFRIWVNEKNSSVRSPSDLAGKKVGVVTGTSNEVWSRSHLKNSVFVDYDNDGLLFSDLANGRIDATIQSHFGGLAQRDGSGANADGESVRVVGTKRTDVRR
nr:transporter substrate-binding domain-containing protein [Paraburkholderia heleia]